MCPASNSHRARQRQTAPNRLHTPCGAQARTRKKCLVPTLAYCPPQQLVQALPGGLPHRLQLALLLRHMRHAVIVSSVTWRMKQCTGGRGPATPCLQSPNFAPTRAGRQAGRRAGRPEERASGGARRGVRQTARPALAHLLHLLHPDAQASGPLRRGGQPVTLLRQAGGGGSCVRARQQQAWWRGGTGICEGCSRGHGGQLQRGPAAAAAANNC